METEDLRNQLAFQVEQNSQLTLCMDEYSKEITRLMDGNHASSAGDSKRVREVEVERDQVQSDLEKTETVSPPLAHVQHRHVQTASNAGHTLRASCECHTRSTCQR
jgi:hypothetical protein